MFVYGLYKSVLVLLWQNRKTKGLKCHWSGIPEVDYAPFHHLCHGQGVSTTVIVQGYKLPPLLPTGFLHGLQITLPAGLFKAYVKANIKIRIF